MKFIPPKHFSWFLLVLFFVFDDVFSYYAVTRLHGREANLVIAPFVEAYPLLYFLCIPLQTIIVFAIAFGIRNSAAHILKRWHFIDKDTIERITFFALVIYWAIGNSFFNLSFLLGHRLPMPMWTVTSIIGVLVALIYADITLFAMYRKN